MRDVPVVAGRADGGVPQQPAVLRERRGKVRAVHGAEGPGQDARHDLSEVDEVGETVMAKPRKSKNSKSNRKTSDVGCPDAALATPFPLGGVIMPHVVSPEIAGGDVVTPRIAPITPPNDAGQAVYGQNVK